MSIVGRSKETESKLAEGFGENGERLLMGIGFLSGVMKIDCGDGCTMY